jgi:Xaa-Pro aminopeptidase
MPAMSTAFALEILDMALRRGLGHVVGMRVHHWGATPDGPGYTRHGALVSTEDGFRRVGMGGVLSVGTVLAHLLAKLVQVNAP